MSAEVLRRAAARIHHDVDFGQAHGDDTFLLAVADWLEHQATAAEFHEQQDAENEFVDDYTPRAGTVRALAVARAYLNESA